MTTQVMATVVGGELKLDQPLNLPNAARVKLIVEVDADVDLQQQFRKGVARIEKLKREQPINSGKMWFTRDQLHERD